MFLFKMQDCPSIDYENKKGKKKKKQKGGFGTPISKLSAEDKKLIR